MKTQVLAVRLPQDQFDTLQKMADSRGLKISELAKEMLSAGIAGSKSGSDASANLLARIDQLEDNLTRAQKEMAPILIAALGNTAGARYLGNLCALYADDIISYLATQKPLDDETKALRDAKRQADEDAYANACIKEALEGGN
jgi:hypothetical protein